MKVPHAALALVLALATTTAGARAGADDATLVFIDKASGDRADDLSKRGLALASGEKKYPEAEALLREAWGLKRSYDIAANLGIVDTKLEKWREAAELLSYAFRTFPGNGKPEHKRLIETTLAKAAQHVAAVKLIVRAKAAAPGDAPVEHAEVSVDGTSVGVTPVETVFLDPGQHTLAAERPGVGAGSRVVDAQAGASMDVEVVLQRQADPPPGGPGPAARRPLWPTLVTGGAAILAVGVGAGLAGAASAKRSDAVAVRMQLGTGTPACAGTPSPTAAASCQALQSDMVSHDMLDRAALGAFIAGGALAVAAAGLGAWAATGPKDDKGIKSSVRLAPLVGTSEAVVVVVGSW
jgi:hypothetical protein